MRVEGSREFIAPREAIYEALTDPELVASAIPALESVDVSDAEHWTATVKVPVAPRLRVAFSFQEQRPPDHARLHAQGKSFGSGVTFDTFFDLAQQDGRTTMRYEARFGFSGLLGRMGEHVLRPIVEHQIDRVVRAVERRVATK